MTPHKDGGAGTFILDRMLGKLGRLKVASGTTDRDEFDALNSMITTLRKQRRWDLLGLLAARHVSPLELLEARDQGKLNDLPSAEALLPLNTTVERWLKGADLAPRTKDDYRKRLTAPVGTKVGDLPAILRVAKVSAIESGKRQTFNNQLDAARSLCGDVPGLAPIIAKFPESLDVAHRPGNPQEPEQIRALALTMPYPDELWSLCLTGMRQGEYFPKRFETLSDRIRVEGEKGRLGRPVVRFVPLVYRPTLPRIAYSTFYKALRRDSGRMLNVHDLRKTAQYWWDRAGIPDWRVKLYAGHSEGRERLAFVYRNPRDLTQFLTEDAERMREWLGDPPRTGLRVAGL